MSTSEWSLSAVQDVIARAVPDHEMVVCGGVRRTYGDVAERTRALAAFLSDRGVGLQLERDELPRWESGQDAVALLLYNCVEYLESMYGAYRARAVPFNVNQHYTAAEIGALFAHIRPGAVVYHRSLGPLLEAACDVDDLVIVDVDDESGVAPLAGSTNFETAANTPVATLPTPSPDDLYIVCTGGTTGQPKAVLWRQADIYVSAMRGTEAATAGAITEGTAVGEGMRWFPVAPLMHAAAQWTAFSALHLGMTVVLNNDARPFDPREVLSVAERERVFLISIVGDAHAKPLIEELRAGAYDLSSLGIVATGGAVTSESHKQALFDLLPEVTIVDGYGASETGGMAYGRRTRDSSPDGFEPDAGAAVVSADRSGFLEPGDGELGWTARRGRVPLGYLGDEVKTKETFPIIGSERLSLPGDRARLLADGSIEMLGRDSMVVNTGGEKVFVEEVEVVLHDHPDVDDAVVVGRPSDRFGEEVVAIVALRDGAAVDPVELRDFVGGTIARFKAPRAVVMCDHIHRHANGKADYAWARAMASDAVSATREA